MFLSNSQRLMKLVVIQLCNFFFGKRRQLEAIFRHSCNGNCIVISLSEKSSAGSSWSYRNYVSVKWTKQFGQINVHGKRASST